MFATAFLRLVDRIYAYFTTPSFSQEHLIINPLLLKNYAVFLKVRTCKFAKILIIRFLSIQLPDFASLDNLEWNIITNMGDSETRMDSTQEVLLRLREQEFASWRQIMTMSGGSIGFPATLLATGNLPDIHLGTLMLSWFMFIINIAIGAALIRDIIHWNIQLTWSRSDKRNAERNIEHLNRIESHEYLLTSDPLSTPYMKMSTPEEYEVYKKRMQEWYKKSTETAKQSEKILTKRVIGIFMWLFYFSFILGYVFLALSFVIPKILR